MHALKCRIKVSGQKMITNSLLVNVQFIFLMNCLSIWSIKMSQNCKEYLAQGPSMIFYNATIFNLPRYEAQKSRVSSHLKPEFDILWKQP